MVVTSVTQTRFGSLTWNSRASRLRAMGTTVSATAAQVNGRNSRRELRIALRPRWLGTFRPGIEAAARDAEQSAHGADREGHVPRRDERELHSLSFAKNVAAAFKM